MDYRKSCWYYKKIIKNYNEQEFFKVSSNILVTMLVTDNIMSYGKYSVLINKTYCQKNNYDFFVCNKILDT